MIAGKNSRIYFHLLSAMWAAAFLLQSAAAESPPTQTMGHPLEWLHVAQVAGGPVVADEEGREVLLRGFNLIALRSNATRPLFWDPQNLFDWQDLRNEDFVRMKRWGANVIRLVITWEFAEPEPGAFNDQYFAMVDQILDQASRNGIYTIIDFGQYGWSRSLGGNAGAPAWTVPAECRSLPGRPSNAVPPQASPQVSCTFQKFWENANGLQDRYIDLWKYVAIRYRNHPEVAFYDLLNEPMPGYGQFTNFAEKWLFPFYQKLAEAIRSVDARHIVLFQPAVFHSLGIPDPPMPAVGIPNALYGPHDYTLYFWTRQMAPVYPPDGKVLLAADLENTAKEAKEMHVPWFVGETGFTYTNANDNIQPPLQTRAPAGDVARFARDFADLADRLRIGWTWFAYSSTDPAYGIVYGGQANGEVVGALSRPYPVATAGFIRSIAFLPETGHFQFHWVSGGESRWTEIFIPLYHYPRGFRVWLNGNIVWNSQSQQASMPGGALRNIRFDPAAQRLQLRVVPGDQTLVITPLS
jgi:endoglycosylceramidase